ncbi:MAG: ATP-binding protein [Deltaproteobacteria bacterium]|nr:ATP-binding protein [Deltaproteobacteria bacterium]
MYTSTLSFMCPSFQGGKTTSIGYSTSFQIFQPNTSSQMTARDALRNLSAAAVSSYDQTGAPGIIVLGGKPGVGKTHLAKAALFEAAFGSGTLRMQIPGPNLVLDQGATTARRHFMLGFNTGVALAPFIHRGGMIPDPPPSEGLQLMVQQWALKDLAQILYDNGNGVVPDSPWQVEALNIGEKESGGVRFMLRALVSVVGAKVNPEMEKKLYYVPMGTSLEDLSRQIANAALSGALLVVDDLFYDYDDTSSIPQNDITRFIGLIRQSEDNHFGMVVTTNFTEQEMREAFTRNDPRGRATSALSLVRFIDVDGQDLRKRSRS